mgnify:CR=1 FL=1
MLGFANCEEQTTALELIEAYASGDQDAVIKVTQKQLFNFLDAEACRLSRQLKVNNGSDSIL